MKRLLIVLILAGIAYGGYLYYRQSQLASAREPLPIETQSKLIITQASDNLGNFASVLGSHIESIYEGSKEQLNDATGGQSDPVINKAVANLQSQMQDLPKETVEKVKYEFCRGIVSEYESSKENE